MKQLAKILLVILSVVLLLLSGMVIVFYEYINRLFNFLTFEQIIFNFIHLKGSNVNNLDDFFFTSITSVFAMSFSLIFLYIFIRSLVIQKRKYKKLISTRSLLIFSLLIFSLSFSFVFIKTGGIEYLKNKNRDSYLFEKYYIDGQTIDLSFPKNKRNLIYIIVESLESSNVSKANGGAKKESSIPYLEKIALDNINFSNNDKIGGARQVSGTGWTIAGMISHTAGIPFKVNIEHNSYKGFSHYLAGAYTLGNVLEDNGYDNYIMLGSNAEFAGRDEYFSQHGNYEIMDYYWAIDKGLIPDDYLEWWGYEDNKLFEFAKDELSKISKNKKPFNFVILTADTHFFDGYIDESCRDDLPFKNEYENSYYCEDKMINSFISWIKEQKFYSNTTIVITGDHLTMQSDIYKGVSSKYERRVYNAFINSYNENIDNIKNREFTTMDMYPTILSSLGVNIEGERIGLGTNLFSGKKTLLEELGYNELNSQIKMNSNYYNTNILYDSYDEVKDKYKTKNSK